jgi:hypothetical protein
MIQEGSAPGRDRERTLFGAGPSPPSAGRASVP